MNLPPAYQVSYGLGYSKRAVPDVSYDADPSTGVAVYCNSQWIKVGGTSVGAPQWAAIQALGYSASNVNLYGLAKIAYSSFFRDITSGSNGLYNATLGYDNVTGLGSPLTDVFGALTVSPTSGPAGASLTLNGVGFTSSNSVNISYLNPVTSSWVSIANNSATSTSQNFNYTFNVPDLLQNSPAGDNAPASDNIIFRAQGNNNGHTYNTTIPYTEYRRGLTQVASATATGLYGNNTDLSTTVFVQNGQSIAVAGEWFTPGTASLLWDGTTSLGTAIINGTGFFNTTVHVPTTTAGQHTLTINDGTSFCVNITRLPTVTDDYNNSWHTTDFPINLTPDYNGTQTYYSINNGPVQNVAADGQPVITTEGSNNALEYWSTWDVYGTGAVNLQNVTLTGIQLDKTPPQGSIEIDNGATVTSSSVVTVTVSASDSISGISQITLSNDQVSWETYTGPESWSLTSGDGVKTVYCQIQDNAGLITTLSSSIILSTEQPSPSMSPSVTSTVSPEPTFPSPSPSATPNPSPNVISSPSPSISPTPEPSATFQVPELSIQIILAMLALSTILFVVNYRRKPHIKQ